jgi:acetylornithine/N-succinyldiaminopimelate aminotransferase
MPTYNRYPLTLVRGEGLRVFDDRGNAYVDFAGGIACIPIGHSHPDWVRAVQEQAATLTHVSNLYSTEPQEELASRLVDVIGIESKVFFSNSGAEANEAALKIARRHGRPKGRTKVIALQSSFHGRTFAALAATGQPEKHAPFQPLPEGFAHVPPNDVDALDRAVDVQTAAVLVEPVLGEGGVLPLDPAFLRAARDLCDERGALLIFDEIQTGVGRCGSWYAFQRMDVLPDVLTSAKALAGGLPIGATVARDEFAFGPGEHASTFGGGPLVCRGALAVLDVIEREGLVENAREQGGRLLAGLNGALRSNGSAGAARGLGLLVGAPVGAGRARGIVEGLMARGFLATEAGPDVVRATPPLTVDAQSVDAFVAAFGESLGSTGEPPESKEAAG